MKVIIHPADFSSSVITSSPMETPWRRLPPSPSSQGMYLISRLSAEILNTGFLCSGVKGSGHRPLLKQAYLITHSPVGEMPGHDSWLRPVLCHSLGPPGPAGPCWTY
ncbi:hypothetical protein NHX12_031273 [Muraenolepis orangiensis]|uniref:Uncharacterized protein n=1 Tax=Muraenolepis orangiensis TaxID=630683 RepID=A0A9Q0E9B2_9TELE|nr:hypothetical protein NHX12_031273 [Muraenolepis orangiensis]